MKYLKSYRIFELQEEREIPWSIFKEFLDDAQDVFVEIMDEGLVISEYGDYSFEYMDDFIFLKFKRPSNIEDLTDLYEDIKIAINRLSDKYEIEHKIGANSNMIKLSVTLQDIKS